MVRWRGVTTLRHDASGASDNRIRSWIKDQAARYGLVSIWRLQHEPLLICVAGSLLCVLNQRQDRLWRWGLGEQNAGAER